MVINGATEVCPSNPKSKCRIQLWIDDNNGFPERILIQCAWCGQQKLYYESKPRVTYIHNKKSRYYLCTDCGQWNQTEEHDCPKKEIKEQIKNWHLYGSKDAGLVS